MVLYVKQLAAGALTGSAKLVQLRTNDDFRPKCLREQIVDPMIEMNERAPFVAVQEMDRNMFDGTNAARKRVGQGIDRIARGDAHQEDLNVL